VPFSWVFKLISTILRKVATIVVVVFEITPTMQKFDNTTNKSHLLDHFEIHDNI